jgi:teichuronic acid biosynthesis glycosyltransferase TuaC
VKVLVVAEYYPRAADPALGIWAHRQAMAAAQAGAELRVLVLHRPIPPIDAVRSLELGRIRGVVSQPGRAVLDGIAIDYVRYLSPPRGVTYGSWGAWAAPLVRRALARIRREFRFDLVHAHYAVPAGDAMRRAMPSAPLVVSVHGHDVHGPDAGSETVQRTLRHARLVLANSRGTEHRCRSLGARNIRVVHLGTDVPPEAPPRPDRPLLVTVGNLVPRKRHGDVIAALPALRRTHPDLRYVIVGDGPERDALARAADALGVREMVEFMGALPPSEAVALARSATLFVLPSVDEAFGVAYIEAMAAGVPAIGCLGEDGPEELAASGGGIVLVPPRDRAALAARIEALLSSPAELASLGWTARATVTARFTWERCGAETVAAYESVLARR